LRILWLKCLASILLCGRRGKIDHSWNEGELENFGKDAVIDYLRMPEKVKSIDRKLDRLIQRLAEALGGLIDVEGSERFSEGQRRLAEYVS
jgi:hypothetical protein